MKNIGAICVMFDNDNTISLSMHDSGAACVIFRHVSEGASCPH